MNDIKILTLQKDNITDFARERNDLLSKAKSDWVFFLDSDEKLTNEKISVSNNFSAYRVTRKNFFLGKYVGTDKIVRLGRKSRGKWVRRIHETWKINGRVGKLERPIIIHNTADNLSDYIKKMNFYSTLHAKANKEEGKKSSAFKIILFPKLKFFVTLIKSRNVVFSIMQAFHSFLSWSKLYFLGS